jgi:hypothetical protein
MLMDELKIFPFIRLHVRNLAFLYTIHIITAWLINLWRRFGKRKRCTALIPYSRMLACFPRCMTLCVRPHGQWRNEFAKNALLSKIRIVESVQFRWTYFMHLQKSVRALWCSHCQPKIEYSVSSCHCALGILFDILTFEQYTLIVACLVPSESEGFLTHMRHCKEQQNSSTAEFKSALKIHTISVSPCP